MEVMLNGDVRGRLNSFLDLNSDCDSKAESIMSDDTMFSEDYILSLENDDEDKSKDFERSLTEMLTTISNRLWENRGTWERKQLAVDTDQSVPSSHRSDDFSLAFDGGIKHSSQADQEFFFIEPLIRRSSSLKSCKTPPYRKKAVRFADALGLDLESVRHVLDMDSPPVIPLSAKRDLHIDDLLLQQNEQFEVNSRYLVARFPQPSSLLGFIKKVYDNKVVLENCAFDDGDLSILGIVRVMNLAFLKKVDVRYTFNNWLTYDEIPANYVHNSTDGPTDKFSFSIRVPSWLCVGCKVQFCIMFTVNGQTFWDNNYGCNYTVECVEKSQPARFY